MGNATAQLIVSLVDKVTGPAKGAASALKSIDQAADGLGASAKGADTLSKSIKGIGAAAKGATQVNWSKGFTDEIAKLGVAGKKLDDVKRAWEGLTKSITSKNLMSSMPKLDQWERDTIATLKKVERVAKESNKARRGGGDGGGAGGLAAGVLGSYGVRRVAGAAVKAGATNMREDARDYLGGLTASETATIVAAAKSMSATYKSMDYATAHERLRDTGMSLGDVGKAVQMQDTLGAGHTVLQSLKGPAAAIEESRKFFKALDTLGKVEPTEIRTLYDGYIKALGVEGADMNMGDLFKVAKMAKSGGSSLSPEFLMSIAPALMQDMGPDRLGTALGSMVSQVIGGRATAKSKGVQQEYGLRDKKGKFLDEKSIMQNPFNYAIEKLIPALQKKGVDINDNSAVTGAMSKLFSNQMVADLFTKIVTQLPQYQRKAEQYGKAPGIDAAKGLPNKDPFVALDGLMAQLRNWGASLTERMMPATSTGLDKLATLINGLAESAKSGGSAVGQITGAIGALVAGSALASTALRSIFPGVFGAASGAVAGPAAVIGGVLAGGATAAVVAAEIVKNNPEGFKDVRDNSMLGAMSGDTGLASAIGTGSPEIVEMLAKREAEAKAAAAARLDAKKSNFGDMKHAPEASAPGTDDSLGDLGDQVQGMLNKLDGAGPAADAGQKTGAAFTENLQGQLSAAEAAVAASVGRMQGMLNFSASPTISPKVNAPSGGAAPGKQSARDTSTKLGSLIDDRSRGSFVDSEYS
jgi:hypothetical protein